MAKTSKEDRQFILKFARSVVYRKSSTEEVEYALDMLAPLDGYKALGLKTRLRRKLEGLSTQWSDM
jgi:hypothetical protein